MSQDDARRKLLEALAAVDAMEAAAEAARDARRAEAARAARERLLAAQEALAMRLVQGAVGEGLPDAPRPGKVFNEHMTPAAVRERNVAISEAKAGDELARLVRERLKISLNAYAKKLGIAPSSLTNYRKGKLPAPRAVAEKVKRDTGFTAWPRGVAND